MSSHEVSTLYPADFVQRYAHEKIDLSQLPLTKDLVKQQRESTGIGIYAVRGFARGALIGHFLAEPSKDIKQHSLQRSPDDHLVDPYFVGYLLHSCNPNVVLDMHQQKVFCIRDIAQNEPLYMDYASTEDTLFNQFACACGAPNCRQWVTGRNEPVNAEGLLFLKQKTEVHFQRFTQQHKRRKLSLKQA